MNPTALIAEDEPLLAEHLATELKRLWPSLNLVARVGHGAAALDDSLRLAPEVVFLDIRMPGMSGLEVAQALAEDWPQGVPFPLIVFVTAFDQYAIDAFGAHAVDYLVKPITPDRLASCVKRLQDRLAERTSVLSDLQRTLDGLRHVLGATAPSAPTTRLDVITASSGNTVHFVPVDEVIYFEAADKYIRVVTSEREHLIRLSLRELLPQLDPQRFWQVHRSVVVQARCIRLAVRQETGKVTLHLHGRPEQLTASRLYAHLFKGL